MSTTSKQAQQRLEKLIDDKLSTNGRGEISAETVRHVLKAVVNEVFLEVENLLYSAKVTLSPKD